MAMISFSSSLLSFFSSSAISFAVILRSYGEILAYSIKLCKQSLKISKKDFYKNFNNVVSSASWQQGNYNYSNFPSWANRFLFSKTQNENLYNELAKKQVIETNAIDLVGSEIRDKIKELGKIWRNSKSNPKIDEEIKSKWEKLILEWKENKNLPLVVRKQSGVRGSEIQHLTGRKIIITDNSFSQWIYCNILDKNYFTITEIQKMLENDEIPMCFAVKKEDVNKVKYKKTLGKYSVNNRGWKLCHIDGVGLNSKIDISKIEIIELEEHFIKLANPKNMFLLPLEIGALGEIQEFIDEQK